jgi:hypothetical protein
MVVIHSDGLFIGKICYSAAAVGLAIFGLRNLLTFYP